ncbi:MAG: hypothetical protein DRO23_05370 [Thermoprotei archaeon]|nr:MAG: hypothetical protein DRO23_05370 [Thermoprotei archaeon]
MGLRKKTKCEICEENYAEYVCKICKRNVCLDHFNLSNGICVVCNESLCELCREYLATETCIYCGKIICERCSVQLDTIRYVCLNCYYKSKHVSRA